MRGWWLVAIVLLAGCAQPPHPTAAPQAAAPSVEVEDVLQVQGYLQASSHTTVCPPTFICSENPSLNLLVLQPNQTATHVTVDLRPDDVTCITTTCLDNKPPRPVHAALYCTGNPICPSALAVADGIGALHLEANVTLPPGIELFVLASVNDTQPDEFGMLAPSFNVHAQVTIHMPPSKPPRLRSEDFSLQGTTGPCVLLVECDGIPGYSGNLHPPGRVHAIDLNITWTAATPFSQSMWVQATCGGQDCGSGTAHIQASGTSPLRLVGILDYPAGASVAIDIHPPDPTGNDEAYPRQDFQLHGRLALFDDGLHDG